MPEQIILALLLGLKDIQSVWNVYDPSSSIINICSLCVNQINIIICHKLFIFKCSHIVELSIFFKYGDYDIKLVPLYKYLGLVLNEHIDYQLMAKVVAKSANRGLGLLIAKSKVTGGMLYDVFKQLYNALVQPVIDCGAGIWGIGNFSCIESVQYKACRFFLVVGKYTPNKAIEGEMVWTFPQQRIDHCMTCLWCRMMNMSTDRFNSRVFKWANMQNVRNWNSGIKTFFT